MNNTNINMGFNIDRSLHALVAFISFTAVGMAIESCSTIPKAEIASDANPTAEVLSLNKSIQEGYANQYDILANDDFTKAVEYDEDAKNNLNKGKSNENILDLVSSGKGYFIEAKNKSNSRRPSVERILKARSAALAAGIRNAEQEEKLKEVDQQLRSNSDNFNTKLSENEFLKFENDYYSLELLSIQNRELNSIRNLISSAKNKNAVKYAPKTYLQAETDFKNAENAIKNAPYDRATYQSSVDKAQASANYLFSITSRINTSNPRMNEETALQVVKQDKEPSYLQTALNTEEASKRNLEKTLTEKEIVLSQLQSKQQRQEAIASAQNEFTEDEAEVFQQGDKVLIRLKKINFPSGSAKIPSASDALLSKVMSTIDRLNPDEIKVEGHTDTTGSPRKNIELSQLRAMEIANYLKNDPKSTAKIEAVGRGYEKPIATNKTAIGRAQNRRVDIIITPKSSI